MDLNFDLKSLFSSKKDGNSGSVPMDKTVIKRVAIVGILFVAVFGSYFFLLKPSLDSQENKIKQLADWKTQIKSCEKEIKNLNVSIDNLINEESLKSGLFVSNDEFENFYAELTEATIANNLRIINITRGEELAVRLSEEQIKNSSYKYKPVSSTIPCEKGSIKKAKKAKKMKKEKGCKGDNCGPVAYYKMTVTYEIEGNFGNYVQFRNVLANKEKIVNIESEVIDKNSTSDGRVKAIATVSLVRNVE